jgi:hypothetical protein
VLSSISSSSNFRWLALVDKTFARAVREGAVLFKGRPVEKLVEDLPRRPRQEFDKCLDEDFSDQA